MSKIQSVSEVESVTNGASWISTTSKLFTRLRDHQLIFNILKTNLKNNSNNKN